MEQGRSTFLRGGWLLTDGLPTVPKPVRPWAARTGTAGPTRSPFYSGREATGTGRMKIFVSLAIAFAGWLSASPAAGDWQYTKWDMTIDQAARASGNALRPPNPQEQSKHAVNGLPPGIPRKIS